MKKPTFLAVMMLLGSGLTKAIVFEQYADHPMFTFWNVDGQHIGDPIVIKNGIVPRMYFNCLCLYSTTVLNIEAQLTINGFTLNIFQTNKGCQYIYRGSCPIKRGTNFEVMMDFPIPQFPNGTKGDLTIIFSNQDQQILAAGSSSIEFRDE